MLFQDILQICFIRDIFWFNTTQDVIYFIENNLTRDTLIPI